MINISNLNFGYQRLLLKNLNLKINNGDYIAILGHNGVGKTTLMKCLLGVNKVDSGMITIDNTDVNQFNDWSSIGYVPQLNGAATDLPITVNEFLNLTAKANKLHDVIKLLEIEDLLSFQIKHLSGGERQKVAIARELSKNDLKFLILDEPTSGVDLKSLKNIFANLKLLNNDGLTIIIITHQFSDIDCDVNKIYEIEKNEVIDVSLEACQFCP